MLSYLKINNLALIEEVSLEFNDKCIVISGESGAGKTIILNALALILGARADKNIIRYQTKSAEIQALFLIEKDKLVTINDFLEKYNLSPLENDELILRRIISDKSKCFINNCLVSLKILQELGDLLLEYHKVGENHYLYSQEKQLHLIDTYNSLAQELKQYQNLFSLNHSLKKEKQKLLETIPSIAEIDILNFQYQEIDEKNLEEKEDEKLNVLFDEASNAEQIKSLQENIRYLLNEDEQNLKLQINNLARLITELSSLKNLNAIEYIDQLLSLVQELEYDVFQIEIPSQDNFEQIKHRLDDLASLKRKYGPSLNEVISYKNNLADKIALFESSKDKLNAIDNEIILSEQSLQKQADRLSSLRNKGIETLLQHLTEEVRDLDLQEAKFAINLSKGEKTLLGQDKVEVLFSANKGEKLKPLKDTASAGEGSRVMLAIKNLIAKVDNASLLVFDEIDANVGGKAVTKIANKLYNLAKYHQVFCISHNVQLASLPCQHIKVIKEEHEGRTFTRVFELSFDERVDELCRMLGNDNQTTRSHATELLTRW